MSATSSPAIRATAAAPRALVTLCSPWVCNRTGERPSGVTSTKDGRAASSRATSAARTSAPEPRPNVVTRAAVRVAMARTSGSSALSTAVPSGGRASISSPFAAAIACRLPNSPRWAAPTLRTRPIAGGAMAHSAATCPAPRAPISATRNRVVLSHRSTVSGSPISLLKEPADATVGPRAGSRCASTSLVLVLPLDPVSPTTVGRGCSSPRRSNSRSRTARASRPRAATPSSTTMAGTPTGRVATTPTAPARTAASTYSCPST